MNEQNTEETYIDLSELFRVMLKNIKLIVIATIACMVIAFLVTTFFISKKYESKSSLYLKPLVNNGVVDNGSLATNRSLVSDYIKIMQGDRVLSKVAKELNVETNKVKSALNASADANSTIINVSAITDDAEFSKEVVVLVIDNFIEEMKEINGTNNFLVINDAKVIETAVSPSKVKNTVLGALLGMVLSCGYVFVKFMFDKRLKNRAEAESFLGIPVLCEIPYYED